MAFKKDLTPLTKKGHVTKHEGKGSVQERLPSRHAMATLTGGSTVDRSMNGYAKATPSLTEATPGIEDGGPSFT